MPNHTSRPLAPIVAGALVSLLVASSRFACSTIKDHRQRILVESARDGDLEQLRRMIRLGADPKVPVHGTGTALLAAASSGRLNAIRLLLDLGVDPELGGKFRFTPLMAAAQSGNVAAMELLVSGGANVNARESFDGWTALMIAAEAHKTKAVEFLVAHGADPHATPDLSARE